ncbi:hypothetical protein J2Z76_001989 [Sedimentibacter acidaminivorans]|uniref:Uncharacterized protein n=1 Tax=Sedimentibacter acidaminivorans TaxID=913099 RepID=A0ABS4GEK3_9FIRM|nr:hypothetical protein [Sedimentibacter acidaminivorans]MBP1926125.1 hypothetical protein [Sedimentibacter acidaminivorans]
MKKIIGFVIVIALLLSTVISAAPGDSSDPIVVLSYLDQRLTNLISEYKLDTISNLSAQVKNLQDELKSDGEQSNAPKLEIVEIHTNEKLIAQEGTELILRGGEAFIIASELGGLTNVTKGKDFVADMSVPANNLLIVPRSDGRGVYTNDYAIFMVRGTYEVIK